MFVQQHNAYIISSFISIYKYIDTLLKSDITVSDIWENDQIYIWQKFRRIDGKWPNLHMTEI